MWIVAGVKLRPADATGLRSMLVWLLIVCSLLKVVNAKQCRQLNKCACCKQNCWQNVKDTIVSLLPLLPAKFVRNAKTRSQNMMDHCVQSMCSSVCPQRTLD
ncbi:unnamed protein product [Soboliphyme baturini]|uniref:Saposin B-type domain-containing protein n=1 Tax=Soboliphyme baturini TaxID=241478 RepID=A0A183IGG0_9BILA|nr:unnamed protein product [Soboliphyme baturini]